MVLSSINALWQSNIDMSNSTSMSSTWCMKCYLNLNGLQSSETQYPHTICELVDDSKYFLPMKNIIFILS